jgi:hypothetical protein
LKAYIEALDKDKIKKVVVFSSSWLSKHTIVLIQKGLKEKGIPYVEEFIYARGKPNQKELDLAKEIAKNICKTNLPISGDFHFIDFIYGRLFLVIDYDIISMRYLYGT